MIPRSLFPGSLRCSFLCLVLLGVSVQVACAPDVPQDPKPAQVRVQSVLSPADRVLPLPNAAAVDADGTLPNQMATPGTAQDAVNQLIDDLQGWPVTTAIEVPFDGELNVESLVPDHVYLLRVAEDGGLERLEIGELQYTTLPGDGPAKSKITIVPATRLQKNARYGVIVTTKVQGANGLGTLPASALFIGLNDGPIVRDDGTITVPQLRSDPDRARQLEIAVRRTVQVLVDGLPELGLTRQDVSAAFTWRTNSDTSTVLDSATATIPLPNTVAMDPEPDGRLTFPATALSTGYILWKVDTLKKLIVEDEAFAQNPTLVSLAGQFDALQLAREEATGDEPAAVARRAVVVRRQLALVNAMVVALTAQDQEKAAQFVNTVKTREVPSAQATLDRYLDYLHGYTPDVALLPIEVPLDGPIDQATLTADSVQLWRVTGEGRAQRVTAVSLEYVEEMASGPDGSARTSYKIKIRPQVNLALNTEYFAFATREIKTPGDKELLPGSAMLLALQPADLVTPEGTSLVAQASDADARAAAGVQRLLAPFVQLIEQEAGFRYDELASVWSWYTWQDPFAVFDPATSDIPFPNLFLIGEDGTANLPIAPDADALTKLLFSEVNTRDGFSVLGNIWVSVIGAPLDPATLTKLAAGEAGSQTRGSLGLANATLMPPVVVDPDAYEVQYFEQEQKLLLRPMLPLLQSTTYAGILSNRIKGRNGLALQPTSIFVLLGSKNSLVGSDGRSTVTQLPDASAGALEAARQAYGRLFLGAQLAAGDTRTDIAVAFAFDTDNVTEPLQQRRAQMLAKLQERGTPPRLTGGDLLENADGSNDVYDGPYRRGLTRDLSNIAQIQWSATFESFDTLGAMANEVPYAEFTPSVVPATVFVPKTVAGQCEPPFDVVIVHHGLTDDRINTSLGVANEFAAPETCLAIVAPDAPLHGGRSPGSTDLHPEEKPANSGQGFLTSNFVVSKNLFTQGVLDLVALVDLIQKGGLEAAVTDTSGGGGMFSTTKMGILGNSLGGIFATDLVTIDPNVNAGVLTVAPGKLTFYLTEDSAIGEDALPAVLKAAKGTFFFEQVMTFVQWVADLIDPAAFAQYAVSNRLRPLTFDPATSMYGEATVLVPQAKLLVQMAQGDAVAPNVSTEQLARILGVDLSKSTFAASHGFLAAQDPASADYKAGVCARRQAAAFLRQAIDGVDTTIPAPLEASTCVSTP